MPIPPGNLSIPLESTPECARRIGVLFALFALIETQLFVTFCKIAHVGAQVGRLALGSHGFGRWIELLDQAIDIAQSNSAKEMTAEKTLVRALKLANITRNKYAHAGYAAGSGEESLTLFLSVHQHHRATRTEIVNVSILDQEILFFKRIALAMQDYIVSEGDLSELSQAIQEARPASPNGT